MQSLRKTERLGAADRSPTSRNGVATAVVKGKIYIIGGVPYSNKSGPGWSAVPTVEVYDTRIGTWGKAADMPTPRIAAQAAAFDTGFRVVNPKDKLSTPWGKLKKAN